MILILWIYGDQEDVLGFDSFMEREVDTGYRLLDVDQRIVAPAVFEVGMSSSWDKDIFSLSSFNTSSIMPW